MQHADRSALKQRDPLVADFGTRLILANAIAWIVIIILIRLVFF
jgi:hypothetical protein